MNSNRKTGLAQKVGLAPGTLIPVGRTRQVKTRIHVIDYSPSGLEEFEPDDVEECVGLKDRDSISWINIDGVHEVSVIEQIGKIFGLHSLLLEDILNTQQRPKIEESQDWVFLVLKMLYFRGSDDTIREEQVSLVVGSGFVISFQEEEGDLFDPVRERIRHGRGRIRRMGEDYLAYALMDTIVDNYFVMLERVSDRVEALEEELVLSPGPEVLQTIYGLKKQMIRIRRSVWPLREVVGSLLRGEFPMVEKPTLVFLRDLYDHTIQVIETIEILREVVSGLLDIYLTSLSNRMNEVMKTLTIMASIFIPLTFIAGVYGMNFHYIPELEWRMGYPITLLVMATLASCMVVYFKRRHWF